MNERAANSDMDANPASPGYGATLLRPSVMGATTISSIFRSEKVDPLGLIDSLLDQIGAAERGDLSRAEAMLVAQAHTLDALYNNLVQSAFHSQQLDQMEPLIKLALKAQSQSRATWESLGRLKNPPLTQYVGQANIAHGHQQVNNGAPSDALVPSCESREIGQENKLLETQDGKWVDTRTKEAAGRTNPKMEPVDAIHRPKKRWRKV